MNKVFYLFLFPIYLSAQVSLVRLPDFYADSGPVYPERVYSDEGGNLSSSNFKVQLYPQVFFEDSDHFIGVGVTTKWRFAQTGASSHSFGVELSYLRGRDDTWVLENKLEHTSNEFLLGLNYTLQFTTLLNGRIQPYFGAGVGNLFVHNKSDMPALGITLLDHEDLVNPAYSFSLGSDFLINQRLGVGLGYRFLTVSDVEMEANGITTTDDYIRHGAQLTASLFF